MSRRGPRPRPGDAARGWRPPTGRTPRRRGARRSGGRRPRPRRRRRGRRRRCSRCRPGWRRSWGAFASSAAASASARMRPCSSVGIRVTRSRPKPRYWSAVSSVECTSSPTMTWISGAPYRPRASTSQPIRDQDRVAAGRKAHRAAECRAGGEAEAGVGWQAEQVEHPRSRHKLRGRSGGRERVEVRVLRPGARSASPRPPRPAAVRRSRSRSSAARPTPPAPGRSPGPSPRRPPPGPRPRPAAGRRAARPGRRRRSMAPT